MGHPTEIFSHEPAAAFICAVCHDVLEDASSFKECGHTFCARCISEACRRRLSCPNCRVAVTGSNPNYALRAIIDPMALRCPQWSGSDGDRKRKRGDEDGAPSCDWKGTVEGLRQHSKVCEFKVIECNIDGCKHKCQRKDMMSHRMSPEGLMMHMELRHKMDMKVMDRIYGRKMNEMEERFKGEIKARDELAEVKMKEMELRYEKKLREQRKELESYIEDKVGNAASSNNDETGGGGLEHDVMSCVRVLGATSDSGVHVQDITEHLYEHGHYSHEIETTVRDLLNDGHIYTTIDENHVLYAE